MNEEEKKMALLSVSEVGKIYTTRLGGNKVEALKSVTFDVEKGEYVVVWAFGHLLSLKDPEDYDEKYKKWNISDLPMVHL